MRMNLKIFRVKKNLSHEEIAQRIGFSRAAYSAIEAGKREGRQAFWVALQKAFDIPDAEMWALKKNEE